MYDEIIKKETSKLAKKKGFRLPLDSNNKYYTTNGSVQPYSWFHPNELADYIDAPTQTLIRRWLRDFCQIEVVITPFSNGDKVDYSTRLVFHSREDSIEVGCFFSYEEAVEKGITNALNLIKT